MCGWFIPPVYCDLGDGLLLFSLYCFGCHVSLPRHYVVPGPQHLHSAGYSNNGNPYIYSKMRLYLEFTQWGHTWSKTTPTKSSPLQYLKQQITVLANLGVPCISR